jgi:hypothetical protein
MCVQNGSHSSTMVELAHCENFRLGWKSGLVVLMPENQIL